MDPLHFAHHFFHFESKAWSRLLEENSPGENLVRRLFSHGPLPRRSLRTREPNSFAEAVRLHEENLQRELELGVRAVPEAHPEYPPALRQIPPERRPALVYLRGAPIPEEKHLVAIVGTRHPSDFGRESAESFAAYLTAVGIRVVSGLARGIDTTAHEQSLSLGTIAILGAGVGQVYPEENQGLAENLLRQGGSLLSPFPLDQVPLPRNFPDRNELIAALSAGVVVVEGAEKSGAAITGRHALSMGKSVAVLAQDFRTEFGRGAIRLQQCGGEFVTREEEAVEVIFRRFGGFAGTAAGNLGNLPKKNSFSFREFQKASGRSVPEAIALLEEGILQGRIERFGARYRLT